VLVSKRVSAAAAYLARLGAGLPERGLVLEQRMTGFSNEISGLTVVPQRRIPGFAEPRRGEPGGRLLLGRLGGVPTAVFEGTPHLSAGYLPGECGMAVRTLAALGARAAVLVSSGSALAEGAAAGGVLLVQDRLDLTGVAMLRGAADPPQGPGIELELPGPAAVEQALRAGERCGVAVKVGVAALLHGPLLPTPAERRMLRILGADAVSLGLAPELAAAAAAGVRAAALLLLDEPWSERQLRFCRAFLDAFAPAAGPSDPPGPPGLDGAAARA
jgi:purine-nucleoside phosphorylase